MKIQGSGLVILGRNIRECKFFKRETETVIRKTNHLFMIVILNFHPVVLQDHQGFRELLHQTAVLEMVLPITQPAVAHLDERNSTRVGSDPVLEYIQKTQRRFLSIVI